MLTDAQWTLVEPLLEACRPHAKVPPRHLRRTIRAIFWRHDNGARWRALPEEHGPWWVAAQTFIRWAPLGMRERLLALVQERGLQLGMTFLDGTNIRAHQKAAGAAKGARLLRNATIVKRLAALVADLATLACVLADSRGRAIAFVLAPGQAHELPHAVPLLDRLPRVPKWAVADRGTTSHAFRSHIRDLGAQPAIPTQRHEARVSCPDWITVHRNQVERLWAELLKVAAAQRLDQQRRAGSRSGAPSPPATRRPPARSWAYPA